jgi:hypothetical protein
MENNQDIPTFLEKYKPAGELTFDEPGSGDEDTAEADSRHVHRSGRRGRR